MVTTLDHNAMQVNKMGPNVSIECVSFNPIPLYTATVRLFTCEASLHVLY